MFCNGESTERVLELPVMVYADDLKGGVTRLIREFNVRAVQQLFFKNFFSNNMGIDKLYNT